MGRLKPGHGNNSPSMWSSCKHTYRCGKSIKNSLHVFVSYFPQEATDFPMFLWFTRKSNAASQWIGHLFPMIFPMYINVYHISITQSGNSCFCRHIQTSSSSWSCMYIYILYTVYPIKSNWILIVVGCISPFSWLKGFPPELPTIPRSPTLAVATSIFFSPTDGTTDSSRFWY